jgi:hypothetical protein
LRAGDDFQANFSLTPAPTLSIRGSVVNLPPRSSAVIMLQSRDFNMTLSGADVRKDGSFVISDVAPGAYTILATVENGPTPLMARQSLQIASNSVEGLRLAPQPGGWIRGRLRLESKAAPGRLDPNQMFLALHSSDGDEDALTMSLAGAGVNVLTHVAPDGSFEWKGVPPGNYFVQLVGDGSGRADWYLKSVAAGNRDPDTSGISVDGGTITLDLVASADGAVVEGVVADAKQSPVADAVIVAVPEPRLRGRTDRYLKTVSDQSGHFVLRGIPPGDYTLFAWESLDGDAYFNPEFLKTYEEQGSALHLAEAERKSVPLQLIPEKDDQP